MSTLDVLRDEVNGMLAQSDQNSPISATVTFNVRPALEQDFLRNAAKLTSATKKLPGMRTFDFHKHRKFKGEHTTPGVVEYLIYEYWRTVASFRPQWNSPHLLEFQNSVFALVTDAPVLTFFHGPPEVHSATPLRTGQVRCWDGAGKQIPSSRKTGQDGALRSGLSVEGPRFADNRNGTVTDNLTGLIWLKNANMFGDVGWLQAQENAAALSSGSAGLTDGSKPGDWRMPNINELQSLLDLDRSNGPSVPEDHPFDNVMSANYWSSGSVAIAPALGWYTALAVGPPVFDLKVNTMRMWPVRGGSNPRIPQTGANKCFDDMAGKVISCAGSGQDAALHMGIPHPVPRFTDNHDGTITDSLTGLVWLKNANAFGTQPWQEALESCNRLASSTHGLADGSKAGDWRLPNFNELRSLVDYSCFTPAVTADNPFNNIRPSLYWSSTTVASAPNLARFVFIGVGPGVWDHKSVRLNVWPVRDPVPQP